tara:strand:- start:180 stop:875 length:696 start_codon:yes stop_codon:yes gene_type:complete
VIDVCVTHFGNKYGSKYIDNLEKAVGKHYSNDFNLIVKTDCPYGHWDKISFFDCDDPRIVMDIDFVVNGNLDDLFDCDQPEDTLAAFPRWWRKGGCTINGGFYKINPGLKVQFACDKFYMDPDVWKDHYGKLVGTSGMGEQNFVEESCPIYKLPGHWYGMYAGGSAHVTNKKEIETSINQLAVNGMYYREFNLDMIKDSKFADHIKLVHFIYDDNMIEDKEQWIQDLWNGI